MKVAHHKFITKFKWEMLNSKQLNIMTYNKLFLNQSASFW